eukprot:6177837-Pleurochrysis_carterae.AAC.2
MELCRNSGRVLMHANVRREWQSKRCCAVDAQLKASLASAQLQPVEHRDCEHHKLTLCVGTVRVHGPSAVLAGLRDVVAQAAYKVNGKPTG